MLDDGTEAGVWLTSGQKSYDITYTRDLTRTRGRLHHIAFFVDQREDVLRAADIFLEHGIVMESGPHKHAIQQTFFLYTYEPGGNRVEVCSGGFLIFAPDHEPVVWSQAERAKGQAWGMQTVASFHIKGTPPVPEEDALLAGAQPLSRLRGHAELVRGAYDLHVHVEPDLAKRRIDDLGLARRFAELGLAGFVLKSHYAPTAERAAVVRGAVPGVDALGAIALNAGVGGLNAQAVEIAARGVRGSSGCRRSTPRTKRAKTGRSPPKQPVWRAIQEEFAAGRSGERAGAVDARAASRRCSTSSRATTSCSRPGTSAGPRSTRAVDAALAAGVSRVVVTHPDYPTQGVPVDEQRELAERGAVLERCFAPIHTGKVSWDADLRGDQRDRAGAQRSLDRSRPGDEPAGRGRARPDGRPAARSGLLRGRRAHDGGREHEESSPVPRTHPRRQRARRRLRLARCRRDCDASSRAAARRTWSLSPTASGGSRASCGRRTGRPRSA